MNQTVTAVFDGSVLRPDAPLDLEPNKRYVLTIESSLAHEDNAWDTLEKLAGTVNATPDWAAEHDHYLYGTPKRHFSE